MELERTVDAQGKKMQNNGLNEEKPTIKQSPAPKGS